MIRCYRCGTDNLEGSEFCDECGTWLKRGEGESPSSYSIAPPPPAPKFNREQGTPKPATPYQPPVAPLPSKSGLGAAPGSGSAIRAGGRSDREKAAWLVVLTAGRQGREFELSAQSELLIGRWDADSGIFPDIDLDQDDPEAKVSRRHARITFSNHQYLIEDLGSTNGTFINRGPRLLPGNRQPLNHGDEIIVGKTFLRFVLS
jgi:hypothetical protein